MPLLQLPPIWARPGWWATVGRAAELAIMWGYAAVVYGVSKLTGGEDEGGGEGDTPDSGGPCDDASSDSGC